MIGVQGLTIRYGGRTVLRDLELSLAPGEFVYLQGPSGSGKSTLLRVLNRQIESYEGEVRIQGRPLRSLPRFEARRLMATIHQGFELIDRKTVLENVALAGEVLGADPAAVRTKAQEFLHKVGMEGKEDHFPRQLSGGEMQRTAIARALLNRPPILLADEPTGNLDGENASRILELLWELNRSEGTTVLMVTHSTELVRAMPSRTLHMNGGRLDAVEPCEILSS
ncbi:cell division ATP-binding protein FtsE [Paenibacillus mucilaginosus]|uniref:ABC transporter domain-containing protein n=1 Tax=Paenibacillus mucilaginosus (strain KNP414) TaxID=1036673 RepID=F8F6R9_PAEMK|nr:ATP-binding cassette domain-containing protein [Paenibacillus mucilaginosus]AEI43585.1 hypothetical protein KNP414_05061 [Paenibacillus mucilaginosus KNP414]MCG7211879.1 ATP-binding cassette domain-containing protein [Paenibacillus mucilaginosus]WDM25120.1 ATP-binding cassette domain-containing protein [Paenibacillus mucilaginosus]